MAIRLDSHSLSGTKNEIAVEPGAQTSLSLWLGHEDFHKVELARSYLERRKASHRLPTRKFCPNELHQALDIELVPAKK